MKEQETRELFDTLDDFLRLDNEGGGREERAFRKMLFLHKHPELLGDVVDSMMEHLIKLEKKESNKMYLIGQRKLLQKKTKFALLQSYIETVSIEEKKQMLMLYPELFGKEICDMLEDLIQLQTDAQAAAHLTRELKVLLRVQEEAVHLPPLPLRSKRH